MTSTNTFRIYVASLAAYNAGRLHGEWVDITGKDADDIQAEIDRVLSTCPEHGEEWAIHDYEGFGGYKLSENPNLDDLAEWIELADEHGEAFWAYMSNNCGDASDFTDNYLGEWDSLEDYARDFIDSTGMLVGVNETLANYFDYESFARDMELGGDVWTANAPGGKVWVFSNH